MAKFDQEAIEKISAIDAAEEKGSLSMPIERTQDPQTATQFTKVMEEQQLPKQGLAVDASSTNRANLSIFDHSRGQGVEASRHLSRDELLAKADAINARIEQVKEALSAENVNVKPGYKTEISNKLRHINDYLRVAIDQSGTETTATKAVAAVETEKVMPNPMQRFIGQLTHAQFQMEGLNSYLSTLGQDATKINPAAMMAIQLKIYSAQFELESLTKMLDKALEGGKTIMNIQV